MTEEEVVHGLLRIPDPPNRALCFVRELEGIKSPNSGGKREKFIDLLESDLDEEAEHMKATLKSVKVPKALGSRENMKWYGVPWKGINLENSTDEEHASYLETFSQEFVRDMMKSIEGRFSKEETCKDRLTQQLYQSALHHANFAVKKCEIFCGRDDCIEMIKGYLQNNSETSKPPFVVSGRSGFGKTALLAYAAKHASEWVEEGRDVSVIVRFLGTSPDTSNILDALVSLTHHICLLYKWTSLGDEKLGKIGDVRRFLCELLESVHTKKPESRLIIILDSVDQLADSHGAHSMTWLPKSLPGNIYLIVSMLSDRYTCLDNTKTRLHDTQYYLELPALSASSGSDIVSSYMSTHSRTITTNQNQYVLELFQKCSSPLFLKLVLDSAATWHSYDTMDEVAAATTVQEAIVKLFTDLEVLFGSVFIQRAFGYLSCGNGGLTALEMEDILSCDDDVLNEVYHYHDPPLKGMVRIPSLMWARVADTMKEYLTKRQVDGKTVLTWYHRQFWETAEEWYLSDGGKKSYLHGQLAELYCQENGIRKTIVLHNRGKTVEDADRQVVPQPLRVRNMRKLSCLPYHLFHAGDIQSLKKACLFDFDFIYTKLQAFGIASLTSELAAYAASPTVKSGDAKDISLLCDLLELCYDALMMDPTLLAFNICERLGEISDKNHPFHQLIQGSKTWLSNAETPMLLPTHPMKFLGLNSPLKFNMMVGYEGEMSDDGELLLCSLSHKTTQAEKIQVLNLATKDISASVWTTKITPVQLSRDKKHFMFMEKQTVQICETDTGDLTREVNCCEKQYESVTPRCMATSVDGKFLAVGIRTGKPRGKDGDKAYKVKSMISLINLQDEACPVTTTEYKCRKHIDRLLFMDTDRKLLASGRQRICFYGLPQLEELSIIRDVHVIQSNALQHVAELNSLIISTCPSRGANLLVYNYETGEKRDIKNVVTYENADVPVNAFGLVSKEDFSVAVLGTFIMGNKRITKLTIWIDSGASTASRSFVTGAGLWKMPNCLLLTPDWQFAVIGWQNGDLNMVHLESQTDTLNIRAHGHAVNYMNFFQNHEYLATLGTDNHLKIWNVECLTAEALHLLKGNNEDKEKESLLESENEDATVETKGGTPTYSEQQSQSTGIENQSICRQTSKKHVLNPDEQVLDVVCTDQYVVTANHVNEHGPRFWKIESGCIDMELTKTNEEMYVNTLKKHQVPQSSRMHASLNMHGNLLLYLRKKRSEIYLYKIPNIAYPADSSLLGMKQTFFFLAPAVNTSRSLYEEECERELLFITDGTLEVLDLDFQTKASVEIPKITDDIPNLESNISKKRLMCYKFAVTFDGKYAMVINPTHSKTKKYFDLVDLMGNKFVGRVKMDPTVPWNLAEDSFCFLTQTNQKEQFGIYSPGKLLASQIAGSSDPSGYKSLIYSDRNFLSKDLTLGLEFYKGHAIRIWRTDPLTKLGLLQGHIAEVHSAEFSSDKTLVLSGSLDHTVRVWSVGTAQQLCMFHVYGSVDRVLFTQDARYAVVHCYSAPQRKRAVVLGLRNTTGETVDLAKCVEQ